MRETRLRRSGQTVTTALGIAVAVWVSIYSDATASQSRGAGNGCTARPYTCGTGGACGAFAPPGCKVANNQMNCVDDNTCAGCSTAWLYCH